MFTLVLHSLLGVVLRFVLVWLRFPFVAGLTLLPVPFVASFATGLLFGGLLAAAILLATLALLALLALESLLFVELLRAIGLLLRLPVLSSWLALVPGRRTATLAVEGAGGTLVSLLGIRLVRLLAPLLSLLLVDPALGLPALRCTLLVAAALLRLLMASRVLSAPLTLLAVVALLVLLAVLAILTPELLVGPLLALEARLGGRTGLLPTSLLSGLRLPSLLLLLSALLRAGLRRSPVLRLLARELALLLSWGLTLLLPWRLSLLLLPSLLR